jgi:peptide/nickel transport system substrate-binding protein
VPETPNWVRWIALLAFLAAGAALIPYRASDAPDLQVARADTVIFDLDRTIRNPRNFNPFTPGVKLVHGAHQAMWEPFFILNFSTGELEPWLGLSITSNDTRDVWTLTIRDGVEWSDGEIFDADDVVFTANMVLASDAVSSREAIRFKGHVKSVSKLGPLTVEFRLVRPNPIFHIETFGVANVSSFLAMPEHVWNGKDPGSFEFYPPIGTGPYTFTSATTQRAIWDRNDNWWGAKSDFRKLPEPKRLIWLETGGQENRAQMLTRNDLDAGQQLELGIFEAIRKRNPKVIAWHDDFPFSWTDPCPRQLEINTTVAPWDDPEMRRAVSHIIDRQQIIDIVYEGSTVPSRTIFVQYGAMTPFIAPLVAAGFDFPVHADAAGGKALIEKAGFVLNSAGIYEKDGVPLGVTILANTASTEYTRTVDVIVEQLRRAGIDARALPVEDGAFWGEKIPLGQYEMSYSWLSCGSVTEPWSSMSRYINDDIAPIGERAPGFNNTGRWYTEAATRYSEIVGRIGSLPLGDPQIPGLVVEAYAHLDSETPFIPLVQASKLLIFNQTYWEGWPTADNFYAHPMHWWGSAHLIIHNLRAVEKDE